MINTAIEKRFTNVSRSKTFGNIVRNFDLGNKKVLDLGCSYGEFLTHFGPGSVGITIIMEEVEYGKGIGLDVRYGNIEKNSFFLSEKFDVIFCNNMFEHLFSPHLFLIKIKQYLKPDGILILGVPCIPKINSLVYLNKFRGSIALAHINFFTKSTLNMTVARSGWSIISIRGFHFYFSLIDHLLDWAYPHFYVVAHISTTFEYGKKRMKELEGYSSI